MRPTLNIDLLPASLASAESKVIVESERKRDDEPTLREERTMPEGPPTNATPDVLAPGGR